MIDKERAEQFGRAVDYFKEELADDMKREILMEAMRRIYEDGLDAFGSFVTTIEDVREGREWKKKPETKLQSSS